MKTRIEEREDPQTGALLVSMHVPLPYGEEGYAVLTIGTSAEQGCRCDCSAASGPPLAEGEARRLALVDALNTVDAAAAELRRRLCPANVGIYTPPPDTDVPC